MSRAIALGLGLLLGGSGLAGQTGGAAAPAEPARVTFSRSFQGSQPAFFQIEVYQDGRASYRGKDLDADPLVRLRFTASPAAVRRIFGNAAALDDFNGRKLQSKLQVAYTGDKLLAFDDATRHGSQAFTYTRVPAAAALVSLFEKIATTGEDALLLQRAVQYQPLDVLDRMNQIQSDWDGGQMAEPQLLAPVLRAMIANPAVMDSARHRGEKLLRAFAEKPRRGGGGG
ncbi:MAG TPA: hypothetical protein VMV31_12830 [Terriglobales bacterium]|nr:hypothetical protein [Terriglobales bacterium]